MQQQKQQALQARHLDMLAQQIQEQTQQHHQLQVRLALQVQLIRVQRMQKAMLIQPLHRKTLRHRRLLTHQHQQQMPKSLKQRQRTQHL